MRRWFARMVRRLLLLVAVAVLAVIGVRIYDIERGPPLELWHTYLPPEPNAAAIDRDGWDDYLKAENAVFTGVRAEVTDKLDETDRIPVNRYFADSPVNPTRFAQDWNRSFVLEPAGTPVGAVVLLHGLTDSPYSLRHVAELYRDKGFVAVGIRLPGHGTVPAGLTDVAWEDWLAATKLAVREAKRRIGPTAPLHLVGYSNGGALALLYALDAETDDTLARPDRIVLFSPMVGITRFARFAGLAGIPSILPAFAKAAWLDLLPEFNPFKYNSFPVNAAVQSYQLTMALQSKLGELSSGGKLARLAPVLTFQSVMDSTVSTRAVVSELYGRLPKNGSELVLFDINRNAKLGLLISSASDDLLAGLRPPAPRNFTETIIANRDPSTSEVVARTTDAGATAEVEHPLGIAYPRDVYSLSHVAMPFPTSDGLYGLDPDPSDQFGVQLGAMAARGERGVLIVSLDWLLRISSNPFFPYVAERIAEVIPAPAMPAPAAPAPATPESAPAP